MLLSLNSKNFCCTCRDLIIVAVHETYPSVEHRACVRHIDGERLRWKSKVYAHRKISDSHGRKYENQNRSLLLP